MSEYNIKELVEVKITYLDEQEVHYSLNFPGRPNLSEGQHPAIVFDNVALDNVDYLLVGKVQSYYEDNSFMVREESIGRATVIKGEVDNMRERNPNPPSVREGVRNDSYFFSGEIYLVEATDELVQRIGSYGRNPSVVDRTLLKSSLLVSENYTSLMNEPFMEYIFKKHVIDNIEHLDINDIQAYNNILSSHVLESTRFIDNEIYENRDTINQLIDYEDYQRVLKEYPTCIDRIKEFILENEHLIDTQYSQGYLKEINEQYQNNELINDNYISNLVDNNYIEQISSVRNYLRESGIDNNIIEKYDIGFCLDETQNLLSDKLTIPIRNESNQIIGFGGISIDESNNIEIVYTNKLDDPAFNINKQLYNVNNISSNEPVNIVDNPLDVLICDKNGLSNTVATLGAKSPEELTKLLEENDIKDVNIIVNEQNCNYNYLNEIALHLEDKDINLEVSFYQGNTLSDYLINHEVDELVTENINEIREDKLINQNNPSISPDLSESEVNELLTDNIKEYVNEVIMPKVERLSEYGLNVDEIYANLHCINPLTEPLGQEYLNNVLELTEYSNTFNKNNINSVFKREIENNIQEQGLNINNDRHMMQMEMSPDLDIS